MAMSPLPSRDMRPPDPLEAQARADLAAGRWRKARDAFKDLCKRDRTAFQPLLIEANIGLARGMLDKGLITDARQVLVYLKTIAPPVIVAALETEIVARATASPKSAPDPVALLADGSLTPDDQRRLADQLVVAFNRSNVEGATPAQARVVADLRAIQDAIESVCAGDHDRALELVRPLERDSAFVHWRLFVRAVAAYQRGDADRAVQYFEKLPADSGPGRARAAWLLALGRRVHDTTGTASEAVLEAASALSGEPGWGRVLPRAESLWRAGKHASSYRAVRDAKASFPSDGIDFCSALSEFYFNSIFALPDAQRDDFADALWEIASSRRAKSPTEMMLVNRTLSLLLTSGAVVDFAPEELQELWEAFLRAHERVHGPNARLASVAWAWAGEVLARPQLPSPFHRRSVARPDLRPAIAALEGSIALDPANAGAHLALSSVYATARRTRDRNRLLDVMAGRFPGNKDVLLAAGAGCIDRASYAKAVGYYERALALDRLDPATPDLLATACLRLARQHYERKRSADGRRMLDRTDELAVDAPENLVRGRWCLSVRRGVLETLDGDAALGASALDAARASSPTPAAFRFFVRMAWSFYRAYRPLPASLRAELTQIAKEQCNARDAGTLVRLWRYWTSDTASLRNDDGEAWLRKYLKGAARMPFTRDDAVRLLELLRPLPEFGSEAQAFVSRVLKEDRADPMFRLYAELLQPFPLLNRGHYESILAEARRRGDTTAERLAQQVMGEMGSMGLPVPMPRELYDAAPDEIDDDDDLESIFDLPPGIADSPELAPDIGALLELIAHAPDSEVAQLKKKRPKGMPASLFDTLVMLARVREAAAALPRVPRQRPKSRPATPRPVTPRPVTPRPVTPRPVTPRPAPAPDPDQPDLF